MRMRKTKLLLIIGASGMLSSCDLSQIPGLDKRLSLEDSKAVGAACRHSGRALEDCFALNPNTHPAGVFEGWRDMNDYMTANKIETVTPEIQTSRYSVQSGHDRGHVQSQSQGSVLEPSGSAADSSDRPRFDPNSLGSSAGGAPPAESSGQQSETSPGAVPPRPWERQRDGKNTT